jgi:hypothetical protein
MAAESEQVEMPKHAGGRPTKYKPQYCEQLIAYMTQEPWEDVEVTHTNRKGETWTETKRRANPIRFVTAFAYEIGVTRETLAEWCRVHPEFSDAYTRAREMQSEHLLQCGFMGLSDATMTKFAAVNLTDLRDKTDLEHGVTDTLGKFLQEINGCRLMPRR